MKYPTISTRCFILAGVFAALALYTIADTYRFVHASILTTAKFASITPRIEPCSDSSQGCVFYDAELLVSLPTGPKTVRRISGTHSAACLKCSSRYAVGSEIPVYYYTESGPTQSGAVRFAEGMWTATIVLCSISILFVVCGWWWR